MPILSAPVSEWHDLTLTAENGIDYCTCRPGVAFRPLPRGRSLPSWHQSTESLDTTIIMVDGGAKGGIRALPSVASDVEAYGFEPNRDEVQRAIECSLPYRHLQIMPLALTAVTGLHPFYISRRPGASSTLRPDLGQLQPFQKDHWSAMGDIVEEREVSGTTLTDWMTAQGVGYVDYLKLDTQGNEWNILKAGPLAHIGVIQAEVELMRLYRDQRLIGDVFTLLDKAGFELLDIRWSAPCRRFHYSPDLARSAYRLVWADAIFARMDGHRVYQQSRVLAELGLHDVAFYLNPELASQYRRRRWPAIRAAVDAFIDARLPKQVNPL